MSGYSKLVHLLAGISIVTALSAGCNIFEFASDAEKSDLETAEDSIRDGDYEEARKVLADAVKDSTNAEALYLDAKAQLHQAGVDIAEIVDLVEGQDNTGNDNLALLDIIDGLSDEEQTAWYQANRGVTANLGKIFHGEAAGPFEQSDVALGYTISNLMSGVLGIRDTNQDGIIDDNDFSLDLLFNDANDGFAFSGGSFENEDGFTEDFSGLEVFLGDWLALKTADGMNTGGMRGYSPDDINRLIVYVMHLLDTSRGALTVLLQKNLSSFEPEDIDEYVIQIAAVINYYWYDDGEDTDNDGQTDEETINGIDDDGDGLIDEDTGYHPADPTNVRNTQYRAIWEKWKNRTN